MSSNKQKSEVSFFNANFTSIMSVALVLFLFGIVALFAIAGTNLTTQIKEKIGFDVVLRDSVSTKDLDQLKQQLNKAPYVSSVKFISKEVALHDWEQETGENLIELLGVNPLSAEFDVRVKAQYASMDSLHKITKTLSNNPIIESITLQKDLVDSINKNVSNIAIILGAIALVLTIISFALINNTVRLSVYSKRFLIHTMKLVGAKSGFIRKPFILRNVLNGFIAGVVACLFLGLALYYTTEITTEVNELLNSTEMILVFIGVLLLGMTLCAIAAFFAAGKYIRLDYDSLFKR